MSRPQCLIVALAILIGANVSAVAQQDWQERCFPDGCLFFKIIHGNPACATYNARQCLRGLKEDQIDFTRVKPLICGAAHRAVWGVTGYEDPKHWCMVLKSHR
jgi:hypothetical protein